MAASARLRLVMLAVAAVWVAAAVSVLGLLAVAAAGSGRMVRLLPSASAVTVLRLAVAGRPLVVLAASAPLEAMVAREALLPPLLVAAVVALARRITVRRAGPVVPAVVA